MVDTNFHVGIITDSILSTHGRQKRDTIDRRLSSWTRVAIRFLPDIETQTEFNTDSANLRKVVGPYHRYLS